MSLRAYCMATSRFIMLSRGKVIPGRSDSTWFLYSSGSPSEKMQETDATIMTSRRSKSALVAEWRSLSISALTDASFSIYISFPGTYASGW